MSKFEEANIQEAIVKRFHIAPIGKPRMTQQDKWKKRTCTTKYWFFKDHLNTNKGSFELPDSFTILFCLPFPKSYSNKKCKELFLRKHQEKPDIDNLIKAVLDSLKKEDKDVYEIRAKKVWSRKPSIFIIAS